MPDYPFMNGPSMQMIQSAIQAKHQTDSADKLKELMLSRAKSIPRGMVEEGNVNLYARPHINNPDGSYSTLYSKSNADNNGLEVLYPGINDKRQLSDKEAWSQYEQTGQHLGKFDNYKNADPYAEGLHLRAAAGQYDVPLATSRKDVDPVRLKELIGQLLTNGWTR